MEKYLDIEGSEQKLKVSVSYSKGGYNNMSGGINKRGYYLHVQPVTIEGGWVKVAGFSGVKKFLHEVGRQSNKQYDIACEMVNDGLIEEMKKQCTIKYQ